ncbi:thioredoxin [Flavobacterium sp. SM15]|uniref:thioredoxin n=1 Tax=Flavobacterium sp. SM15 TaxID=2908005 RepID=UPI0021033387|nr:thioredoxin [Flavobacterium sp. SM15]
MSTFSEIVNKELPVLVDFSAAWCGPCQTLAPILKQVKDELGATVSIIKIDIDKNQALAAQFHVRSVPTMLLFKNGQQVWRQSGLLSKNDLVSVIKKHS